MRSTAPAESRPTVERPLRFRWLRARRIAFFGLVSTTALAGAALMAGIVGADGFSVLEGVILALFVPTFAWIVVPFWTAVVGFGLLLFRIDPLTLGRNRAPKGSPPDGEPLAARTALLVPVHEEDPMGVEARVSAMAASLASCGQAGAFHVHLLSDTRTPDVARAEEAAFARLQGMRPDTPISYRRRPDNTGRKAGNIGEFLERCGHRYDYAVVLDADSLMAGDTLVRMVRRMDANPGLGLLQTVPLPVRQASFFGRLVQFAATLYGPMLAAGAAFWQGPTANYWGHNAIFRVRAFRDHARLPRLPGRPPLGGEVLSHDFVEAALLRRGGWEVVLDPSLEGSWEEVPGTVAAFARRDRRWAQGSLQHLRLLGLPGLHALSRLHLFLGAMGYVSSLLWLLILLAGSAYVFLPELPALPLPGGALLLPPLSISLLAVTAGVLFVPKALGVVLGLVHRRAEFGGVARLAAGALAEGVVSVLLAPIMMLHHARSVVAICLGRSVEWRPQDRGPTGMSWAAAARAGGAATAVGLAWGGLTLALSPPFFLWMTPIFAGLLLAVPLERLSGSVAAGRRAARLGIFVTPPEVRTPAEVAAVTRAMPDPAAASGVVSPGPSLPPPIPSAPEGVRMYNAERGLFELQRGRPLLIRGSERADDPGHRLVLPVEGLDDVRLERLRTLCGAPASLVVTSHRARAMGWSLGAAPTPPSAYALPLVGSVSALRVTALASGPLQGSGDGHRSVRAGGEAEAAGLALARLGQLLPAVVACPVPDPMPPVLARALDEGTILQTSADEVDALTVSSGVRVVRISEAPVPLPDEEDSRFILFREPSGFVEHVAIVVGSPEAWPDPVPVRLHSACFTGDLFGSLRCDCGEQLRGSMTHIAERGGGVLLYLAQEGRGIGLGNKFRAYTLQETGLDTIDADGTLGFGADERRYDIAIQMLHEIGVRRIELVTNNPEKLDAFEGAGIEVVRRQPLHGRLNRHNRPYVEAKVRRAGHWLHTMLGQGRPEERPASG